MALKKVALRRLEDGIPNQALREIKALQEIEDNQHVSFCCPAATAYTTKKKCKSLRINWSSVLVSNRMWCSNTSD